MSDFGVELIDPRLTRALRREILRPHLDASEPLPGDELPDALHIGAVDRSFGRLVVGTCFVYPDPCPFRDATRPWRLRQMATAASHRGRGAGRAILDHAVVVVAERGADLLWCYARATAEGFYAANGWTRVGEVFTDAEHVIPHVRMWRAINDA